MFVTAIHSNNVVLTTNVRIPHNVVLTINVRVPISTLSKQQNEYIVPVLFDFVYETRQPPRCHADAPCKSSLSFLKSPLLTDTELYTGFRVSFVEKLFDKMVSFNMLVYNCRCI